MIIAKSYYWLENRALQFGTRDYFAGTTRLRRNVASARPSYIAAPDEEDRAVQEPQGLDEGVLIDLENNVELKLEPGSLWMALNH